MLLVKTLAEAIDVFRREYIRLALADNEGNVSATARQIGLHRNVLNRWLQMYRLDVFAKYLRDGGDSGAFS
jgi:ActR/RegA family two-component response regulator